MKRVLFVATVVKKHIVQFHIPYLKMLKEMGYETHVAAKNDYEDAGSCSIPYCDVYYDVPFERQPWKADNILAYLKLKQIIKDNSYSIIHCHTPMGGVIGRLAAKTERRKGAAVIYTAHGFHFYKGAPLLNWLLYYPIEKYLSKYTDILITINKEDYKRAKREFFAKRTVYVPGVGIDIGRYKRDKEKGKRKRAELGFEPDDFIIVCVAELTRRKNQALLIRAISEIPNRRQLRLLFVGSGAWEGRLKKIAEETGVVDNVRFLGYREDVPEILNAGDLFAFMTYQEGLPVALMEAMASGVPVICSDVRGNRDLVKDGENGRMLLLSKCSPRRLAEEITEMRGNMNESLHMAENAMKSAQLYSDKDVTEKMRRIYEGEY